MYHIYIIYVYIQIGELKVLGKENHLNREVTGKIVVSSETFEGLDGKDYIKVSKCIIVYNK